MGRGDWYRHNKKDTVEGHLFLDVRYLQRRGWLKPGLLYSLSWNRNGEPSGAIQIATSEDAITLIYNYRRHRQEEYEDVQQRIFLTWTPIHWGGQRPWFLCPACQRRAAILYIVGKYFACRKCNDLTYRSCQESDSRWKRYLMNLTPEMLRSGEAMPDYVLMGRVKHMWREEAKGEKEMERRRSRRKRA